MVKILFQRQLHSHLSNAEIVFIKWLSSAMAQYSAFSFSSNYKFDEINVIYA